MTAFNSSLKNLERSIIENRCLDPSVHNELHLIMNQIEAYTSTTYSTTDFNSDVGFLVETYNLATLLANVSQRTSVSRDFY